MGGEQDEKEKTLHALERVEANIFDIQTLFLIEAVAVFDAWA